MIKGKDTVIMFFDVSSVSTGWAAMDMNRKLIGYGAINPKGEVPSRLTQTRKAVVDLLEKYQPTFNGIEDMIAFRNGKVTKMLNFFSGVVYEACYSYNQNEVYFVASSSIKKHIDINTRQLKKEGMKPDEIKEMIVERMERQFSIRIPRSTDGTKNHRDMADALAGILKLFDIVKAYNTEAAHG